jgi:hypothetical protein
MSAGPCWLILTEHGGAAAAVGGDRARRYPDIDTFCPRFFQNPGAFGERRSGGHHIINQNNMAAWLRPAMPVKSPLQVLAALFSAQTGLRQRISPPSQCVSAYGDAQYPASVGRHFISLVEATL